MKPNKAKFKGGGFTFSNNEDIQIKMEGIDIEDGSVNVTENENVSFSAKKVNISNSKAEKSPSPKVTAKIVMGIFIAVVSGVIIKLLFG